MSDEPTVLGALAEYLTGSGYERFGSLVELSEFTQKRLAELARATKELDARVNELSAENRQLRGALAVLLQSLAAREVIGKDDLDAVTRVLLRPPPGVS
jgi:hypothetical protein